MGALFRALISAAVAKFFFSLLFFLGAQLFINAFFNYGIAPSWMSAAGFTGGWSSTLSTINGLLGPDIGPSVYYFMNLFMIPYGLATLLNAQLARFLIRRLFK